MDGFAGLEATAFLEEGGAAVGFAEEAESLSVELLSAPDAAVPSPDFVSSVVGAGLGVAAAGAADEGG